MMDIEIATTEHDLCIRSLCVFERLANAQITVARKRHGHRGVSRFVYEDAGISTKSESILTTSVESWECDEVTTYHP